MNQPRKNNIVEKYGLEKEESTYTLIIDMNSVMKMSLVDNRCGTTGYEYGMVFQTLLQIKMLLMKKSWDYVYAFYDGDNSGFLRYQFYKDYKANRDKNYEESCVKKSEYDQYMDDYVKRVLNYARAKKNARKMKESGSKRKYEDDNENFSRQREIIFKILEELFIRQLICENVEGDDLIAYYVNNKRDNEKIVILTSDRDLTQLIDNDVAVYIPKLKQFVTPLNSVKLIGCPSYNILLKKQICGDSSDNIKGIKGMGEKTLFNEFPKILEEKISLDYIISESKKKNEERIRNKKKPLKCLENIINRVTEGCQGEKIYEINKKIIDLKSPLLTDEAEKEINEISYAPIDPEGRNFENIYKIILENGMSDLSNENSFSNFFSAFNPIVDKEKKRFKKFA
jgi:5'-3' exonuclease